MHGSNPSPRGLAVFRTTLLVWLLFCIAPAEAQRCAGYGELLSIWKTDWEGGMGSWTASRHDVVDPESFQTPDWSVVGSLPEARPGQAAFVEDGNYGDCETDDQSGVLSLDGPEVVIPAGVLVPRLSIDHWFDLEYLWDGGNLKLSVNGGPWEPLLPSDIDLRPYTARLNDPEEPNNNPLASEWTFTGPESGPPSWGETWVNLSRLAKAGDSVRLRLDFGVDICAGNTGWYVDTVEFYRCSAELPPSDCGNGSWDEGEECDDGNGMIGDGCSNICEVEPGWSCTEALPTGEVLDPGFELGTPNPNWTEVTGQAFPPICNVEDCGNGLGSGPASGTWWAWLGGAVEPDVSSVSQLVTIPTTASTLEFQFEAPLCAGAGDVFEVRIDGNTELSIAGDDARCGQRSYATESVDISAYADGGNHTIAFYGTVLAPDGEQSNFFVDDVRLPGKPSVCTLAVDLIFRNGFEVL